MAIDWRIKSYGVQAVGIFVSSVILGVTFLVGAPSWSVFCLALPLTMVIVGGTWWIGQKFKPTSGHHLTPREWEELRSALEDVPVLSVLHLFPQDKRRLERFRYIPLLRSHLWELLAEDDVKLDDVVRAAFLLHTFGQDLTEYTEVAALIPDPVVTAWLKDAAAEPRAIVRRTNLLTVTDRIPELIGQLAKSDPFVDKPNEDKGQQAAWRIQLFGTLAFDDLREGLEHEDPRVRESCLALLEIQPRWPQRRADLLRRINHDRHPTVKRGALELLAMDTASDVLPILKNLAMDPLVGERAAEIVRERV